MEWGQNPWQKQGQAERRPMKAVKIWLEGMLGTRLRAAQRITQPEAVSQLCARHSMSIISFNTASSVLTEKPKEVNSAKVTTNPSSTAATLGPLGL